MMSTESDQLSENRHQEPGSAEESQHAATGGPVWPDRVVPTWSVPPGLIASQAARSETDVAPPDAEPADNDDWPGVAPPAGWFLRPVANGPAGSLPEPDPAVGSEAEVAQENVTGESFASPAPEPGDSPISWYEGMVDPEPDAEPPAPAAAEPGEPVSSVTSGSASQPPQVPQVPQIPQMPAGTGPSRRSILAAEPVVSPTRALWGRPGGSGLPPRRPGPGARKVTADRSPWQTSQRLWTESEIPWEQHPADDADQPQSPASSRPEPAPPRPEPAPPRSESARPQPAPARTEPRTWPRVPHRNPPQPPPQQAWSPQHTWPLQQARPPLVPPPRSAHWSPQWQPAGRHVSSGSLRPEPMNGAWPGNMQVPLSAPVFAESRTEPRTESPTGPRMPPHIEPPTGPRMPPHIEPPTGPRMQPHIESPAEPYIEPPTGPQSRPPTSLMTEPEDQPLVGHDSWRAPSAAPPLWNGQDGQDGQDGQYGQDGPLSADHHYSGIDTLLLEPELPGIRRPGSRRRRVSRRTATIAVPVLVLVAVAVLALALLTGHGPKFGPLAASQQPNQAPDQAPDQGTTPQSALTIGMYPGQLQRGVFQTVNRVVASGNTIVTTGSQTSDGVVRQQFFVSANGGASWRLAPVQAEGGGQPPLGHPAARLAGGPGGWLAVGPQAIWTSSNGLSWTLASTRGLTPMLPGDAMWVLNSTSGGFLAAGVAADGHQATQAVIWTTRDGVTWQRKTAAQLGLAGPGETVQSISYITARGNDTVISGQVTRNGTTYAGVWLSTDGGDTWDRVTVPADHGAGTAIAGLAFDSAGLLAVRPGQSANGTPDGVAYFSPNGQGWQYAGTIGAAAGWNPGLVKGSDFGFVVAGASTAGRLVAFTSTGTGGTWQPTGPLGEAETESVVGATVASAGTIVAVGYTSPSKVSQQPVFLEASPGGSVRPVPLAGIPGGSIPELAVNGLAVAAGQQIAVGSAEGYPAVWRKASGGSWSLATSLSQVSAVTGLEALTGVTHGSSGWLAVGAPGPVVMTSADGTTWQPATGPGSIAADLAGVSAVAAAAGPHGYIIVGKLVAPGGSCVADVWWTPNLIVWSRAHDVNDVTGSSQVLAVAADAHGFVSAGSHNGKPAVWTTTDGTTWTTIVLPVPAGASSAVLQQIAISGNRVVALGQATTPAGTVPIAELSVNGGSSWQQVPFSSPGPDTAFTALTASSGGFTAVGQFGQPGQQQVAAWTSATGISWAPAPIGGLSGSQTGGSYQISALAPSGNAVTGVGSLATQASQEVFTVTIPAR